MTDFSELMNIPFPLTISVLPEQRFSTICANIADHKGHEVMLHQPMQPLNHGVYYIGPSGIRADQSENEIAEILLKNIQNTPHIKGLNNHMGSLATSRENTMRAVMKVVANTKLYFVDSITSGRSVAYRIARRNGIPSLKRDLFIDANPGYDYARKQLLKLIPIVKKQGYAVAIGHLKPDTIRALLDILPMLTDNNIEIVKVSRLMEHAGIN